MPFLCLPCRMKTVLITGGSSGIGFQMSRLFAKDGFQILWVAKPIAELEAAATKIKEEFEGLKLQHLAIDLSLPDSAKAVYDWANANWEIDILVNNAGFGTYGFIEEIDMEKEIAMLHLNVLSVYKLTRLFLEDMLKKNQGNIVNISSNTSFQPVPRMATYSATKAFVKHFSESVNEELRYKRSKVKLTTVCPAAIRNTQFQQAANMNNIRTFKSLLTTTPEEVAKDAYRGMQKGKQLVITGARLRASMLLQKMLPKFFLRAMLKRELDQA